VLPSLVAKSSRPTPAASPFKSPSPNLSEISDPTVSNSAALLSRLRAGSMPQRQYPNTTGPFGQSVFATNWSTGRERTSTLASIQSLGSNGPSSPAQSNVSREHGDNDMQMRTLDYLGLADTPTTPRAAAPNPFMANINLADLTRQANRFRSYSVNAKEKYAEEEDDYGSGQMTPYETQQAQLHLQLAATNAAIQQHNLAVQAYASQASANRPRARTAGVLETPGTKLLRNYYPTPSRLDSTITVNDIKLCESPEYDALPDAVAAMNLGRSSSRNDSMLSPDDNLEGPTRALWLGSIPSSTTVSTLTEMFKSHGPIISARVLTHKNCGFVNFERLESAISARAVMNGKEIFPGAGPVRINFAKPPSPAGTPGPDSGAFPSPSPDPFQAQEQANGLAANGGSPGVISRPGTAAPRVPTLADMRGEILDIVGEFGASQEDRAKISHSLQQAIAYDQYQAEIPPIQEPAHNRVHDAPKLRDIRKRIDNQSVSPAEIEGMAADMLPEIAELSSDYLGNTVVQKLFEHCADDVRDAMLAEIAPHMAEIGVHKNGTWAAQKIIDVCKTPSQMSNIVTNLQPFTVPLFLDQYGNYVLQCCLKFGSPFNDFIFEAMLSQMWEIAQSRYGARAMRACLESHHATKDQQRMLAAAIALHSVQLATNANGALLLTWLLDTCTFPQRRTVLAPQLVPHLTRLCTHKVAYLTVLKVINQKLEPAARDAVLQALFFSPGHATLEAILSDHACGATLIFKVLTTPFFDESIRPAVVENVRHVLQLIKAQPSQGYKRLMDEVGLSTRQGSTGPAREAPSSAERPRSNHSQANGHLPPQFSGQFYPQVQQQQQQQQGFDLGLGMQRADSVDSSLGAFAQAGTYGLPNPMFPPTTLPPLNLQQLQFQQSMLSRAAAAAPVGGFYNMQSGFGGGYANPADPFRAQGMSSSSAQAPQPLVGQGFGAPPGFGLGMGGFGYGQIPMMSVGGGYVPQEQPGSGRRGRVSLDLNCDIGDEANNFQR
jgi:protein JSN1